MNEVINEIRNKVIQKFCRTVLWIDDEIHLDQGLAAEGTPSLFRNKYDEFTRSSLLCHMMGFPAVRPGSDPYVPQPEVDEILPSCKALALQADIIILDWMLGSTDSSVYAEEIVKHVVGKNKGFRFIVVLTNKELTDSDFIGFDPPFFKRDDSDDLWKNESGQFLLGLHKEDFTEANLFETICSALLKVYPDYLHLAALEIAGRIKDLVPQWLSALPSNTDMGILTERTNLMCQRDTEETWRDVIQECVVANLLDDLTTLIIREPLNTLGKNALCPSNVISDLLSKLFETPVTPDVKSLLNQVKPSLGDEPQSKITANQYKQLLKHRDILSISNFLKEIEAYTEFCETKSICGPSICPGTVFSNMFTGSEDIAVCISSACDCIRAESLLFLRGKRMKSFKNGEIDIPDYEQLGREAGGKTVLRFHGQVYIFWHKANSITTKSRTDLDQSTSIKRIGAFRNDILNRLVSRFMSYLRRVGVTQPALSRSLRKEGPDEER